MIRVSVRTGAGLLTMAAVVLGGQAGRLRADQPKRPGPADAAIPLTLVPGGLQTWGDELLFHDWRIQRDARNGRCRLLDGDNVRRASGAFEECQAALEEIKRQRGLTPMKGKAVVLLHGLAHSRSCMTALGKYLEQHGEYVVLNVEYPGTHQSIGADARALASILEHLDGIEEINFVAHSMGNIVVRHYLADQTDPKAGRRPDPRIRRMVMLGPPNHGSSLANAFADNRLFKMILGKPGQELGRHWAWEAINLATPQFEFGIVAGGLGNRHGFNPFLPGDNDGVLPVESTRLAGAADFVVVPILHLPMVSDDRVFQYTLRFLQHGYFVSADRKRPVVRK